MKRITVYLTDRTFEQLETLTGSKGSPQLIKRSARQLLSFAIKGMFRPNLLTITGRLVRPVLLEDAAPKYDSRDASPKYDSRDASPPLPRKFQSHIGIVQIESTPDWSRTCVCGGSPVVPETGMCGPCTFGEADTASGNW